MLLQEALCLYQDRLKQAGIDNPSLDVRLLVAHALRCDRVSLITQSDRVLTSTEEFAIETLIARRYAREPVARILGQREFWGLSFTLNEATLEPRPDSETLVATVLKHTPVESAPSILDLGTGTGCLLLSLLSALPQATGLGIDKSPRAVAQAAANAAHLGHGASAIFQTGNWFDGVDARFDRIISNPPYIPASTIDSLEPEVKDYDPRLALDGGAQGLDPYLHIIPKLKDFLNPLGAIFFEVGINQAASVATLLHDSGLSHVSIVRDLNDVERVVYGFLD